MRGDVTLYLEDPADSIRKLLDLLNQLYKEARYKINIKNSLPFYAPIINLLGKKSLNQSHS
jgi:hypothetical protein